MIHIVDGVHIISSTGVAGASMGSVTNESSCCRFAVTVGGVAVPFGLVFIRGLFSGGTGEADLSVQVDNVLGAKLDFTLLKLKNVGTDTWAELNVRVDAADRRGLIFKAGDVMVLNWTNPGSQVWGVEVGLEPR